MVCNKAYELLTPSTIQIVDPLIKEIGSFGEAERIKVSAQSDLDQAAKRTKEELRSEVAALAVAGAEKILGSEIDKDKNSQIIDQIAQEL